MMLLLLRHDYAGFRHFHAYAAAMLLIFSSIFHMPQCISAAFITLILACSPKAAACQRYADFL